VDAIRFAHTVIRAGLQAKHAVEFAFALRECDDGCLVIRSYSATNLKPIHVGKVEIQQDQVGVAVLPR
jgi:hypothetical protein